MNLQFSDLVQRLEAERNDISYRKRITKPEVKVVTKTLKVIPERFKRIYFHAGRYAAGDRDRLAVEAYAEYERAENL
jgi:spore coat polysaccharide biosynthesis protein SpsF (cytidylyltransferase family)